MGFFDYYEPVPDLVCPICKNVLEGWQGKHGACGLFVWRQEIAYPIAQEGGEFNIDETARKKFRLPEEFEFYTGCENCPDYWIICECKTEDGVWENVENIRLEKKPKLPRKWFEHQ